MESNKVKGIFAEYIGGAKWGDEGKGKITHRECDDAELVIRATGGSNAGHTVIYDGKKLGLHLIPSGVIKPNTTCLIGQGVAFDPLIFLKELVSLENIGVHGLRSRIKISGRAPVVLSYHKDLDVLYEKLKNNPVGTTRRGIGPCYADHDNRIGLIVYDLLRPLSELTELIIEATKIHNVLFETFDMADCVVDPVKVASEYHEYGLLIEEMVVNGDLLVRQARKECWKVVIEGAQGYRLDKNYGDYNDVTSSNCVSAGALIGAHLNPKDLKKVIMITKAYDSRVGNGPFPTELRAHIDENNNVVPYDFPYEGDIIREEGGEYGVTSGRPRRCGWFDAVVLASAVEANGADYICINHMDTLGKIGQIIGNVKICVSYIYQGKEITYYPDDMRLTHDMPIPVYETFDGGWEIPEDISEYDELPYTAKQFIQTIEKITGVVVKFIGIGPKDTDLIVREEF